MVDELMDEREVGLGFWLRRKKGIDGEAAELGSVDVWDWGLSRQVD